MIPTSVTDDEICRVFPPWPLVLIVLDGYEPQLAPHVTGAIASITDETTISVLWSLAADEAWENIELN